MTSEIDYTFVDMDGYLLALLNSENDFFFSSLFSIASRDRALILLSCLIFPVHLTCMDNMIEKDQHILRVKIDHQ